MDYFHKVDSKNYQDLLWNIPEQPLGDVNVVGGHLASFRTPMKIAEFLAQNYPLKNTNLVLPDALKNKLPPLPNFIFLPSTDSGSFADADSLKNAINSADFNLIVGDLSKNSITKNAIKSACQNSAKPLLITRDAVDLVSEEATEKLLMNENLIFFASILQLQKLFRAVYYPKVLLAAQSLVQIAEALHKFTLSYSIKIITFHNDQILVVENGNIYAVPIQNTAYTPINLWSGELAAKIATLNLYNPNNFAPATITAILA